jgi:hypothetical protein
MIIRTSNREGTSIRAVKDFARNVLQNNSTNVM